MAKDTGTVNIHGKEYKTVAARVQEFREKNGETYNIVTEIVNADDQRVVMKASITFHEPQTGLVQIMATGHAEEVRTSSQINRTSALENAETSAIGRALAAFGLAGTEYASADEVAQAITQQRAPAPKSQPASRYEPGPVTNDAQPSKEVIDQVMDVFNKPPSGTEITPKQLAFIKANFSTMNIDERDEMLSYVTKVIGRDINSSTELTKAEAKKVIDQQLGQIEGDT